MPSDLDWMTLLQFSVCNAGFTLSGGTCVACGVNTYKDVAGNQACLACTSFRANTVNPNMGSTTSGACGEILSNF